MVQQGICEDGSGVASFKVLAGKNLAVMPAIIAPTTRIDTANVKTGSK